MQIYCAILNNSGNLNDLPNLIRNVKQTNNIITIPENFKLLVIDDDKDFLIALCRLLKKIKIDVSSVDSGYKAIEILENNLFHLILLDLRMPTMNGAETYKRILDIINKHYIIIMTAYPDDKQIEIINNLCKPYGYLDKPFGLKELKPYINKRIREGLLNER